MVKKPLKPRRIKQFHEVRTASGKPINWKRPPKPNTMCTWTKKDYAGRPIKGTFRTLCHLNRLNNLAVAKYGKEIVVLQRDWNTTVPASAGTHNKDSTFDLYIPGVSWWEQQRFFRANGFGCWYRWTIPGLWNNHIHGFTLPVPEGKVRGDDFAMQKTPVGSLVPGQLSDYYGHRTGLKGHAHDPSWYPKNIEATVFDLNKYVARRARLQAA